MHDLIIGWSIGAIIGLFPILVSCGFALIMGRDFPKRLSFVITSSALAYGLSIILALPLAPIEIAHGMFRANLLAAGYTSLSAALDWLVAYGEFIPLFFLLVLAVAVPVKLRRKWAGIVQATR